MEHVFPELSNVLFCRGILLNANLPVDSLDMVADGFTPFLATFIATHSEGLDGFEPLENMPQSVTMFQTPGFWHQQLCYAISHTLQAMSNYVLLRVKDYRSGRSVPGRAPFKHTVLTLGSLFNPFTSSFPYR